MEDTQSTGPVDREDEKPYEPPRVRVIGTIADLTLAGPGHAGDGLSSGPPS